MAFEYGENIVGYFVPESTYKTPLKAATGNAFRTSSFVITPDYARPEVPERRATRSRMEVVDGKKKASWSMRCTLRPSGTAGTAPDIGDLLKHAFGTETVTPATSVAYTLLKDPSGLSGTLYKLGDALLEGCYGAIITDCNITFGGADFAYVELSGIGADVIEAGEDIANGAGSAITTVTATNADFFTQYGCIKIGTDDNSGAGYQITSIPNYAAETFTIESAATWSNGAIIAPWIPAGTFAGSPLYGTKGTFSLDGGSTDIQIIDGSVSMSTGIGLHENQFGVEIPQAVTLPSERQVNVSFHFLVEDSQLYKMNEYRRSVAQDVYVTVGDTAGERVRLDMPYANITPGARSGTDGLVECTVAGMALGSSGEDEYVLTFD